MFDGLEQLDGGGICAGLLWDVEDYPVEKLKAEYGVPGCGRGFDIDFVG